jgi:hypothetical protein
MTALNQVAPPRDDWCGIISGECASLTGGAPYPFRYRATASGANTATIATVHSSDRPT